MLANILLSAGLGIFASASPGALQAYLLQQTIRHGWRHAWPAVLAPLVSDIPIVIIVLFILGRLPPIGLRSLQVAGGTFLLFLSFRAFRALRKLDRQAPHLPGGPQTFITAVLANGLSAGPYVFWSLIAGPILLKLWSTSLAAGLGFLLVYYLALLSTYAAQVFLFAAIRRVGSRTGWVLNAMAASALAALGLYQIWSGLRGA
jgi:threonine/homoserine/homoserine lactone efflux protein